MTLKIRRFQFTLATAIWVCLATFSTAQVAAFDPDQLQRDCLDGKCVDALNTAVAAVNLLNVTDGEVNSQIGLIAAVLLDAGRGAPVENLADIAGAIASLSGYSTDAQQRAAISQLAVDFAQGNVDFQDVSQPFAASRDRPGRGLGRGNRGRGNNGRGNRNGFRDFFDRVFGANG